MHRSYSTTTPLPTSLSNATLVLLTLIPINVIDNTLATLALIRVSIPAVATSTALPKLLTERTAIKLARQL
jgi:hypothetical protein